MVITAVRVASQKSVNVGVTCLSLADLCVQIRERYGPNLDTLQTGHTVGLLIDEDSCLHLHVNGIDHGVAVRDIPLPAYVFVDLYGQCEQVTFF